MDVRESITIKAPPETLFLYFSDPENNSKWDPKLETVELLTDKPVGKGSRIRSVRKTPMGSSESVEEITEFEENRKFGWASIEGRVLTTGTIQLVPTDDGTEFTIEISGSLPLMMKPFAFLIGRMMRKEIRGNLINLKGLAEA
ncbi:MAG: SRPBCC family protein [Chloroflexi bacterium]|nr:SRPBCC family protein [Chloroflexota bacterium]